MNYRPLGNTGLTVSEVTLGTVELGMDYGFRGSEYDRRPDPEEAVQLIHRALDLGINLIDTARTYGESERLIGQVLTGLSERPYIATKVFLPDVDNKVFDITLRHRILNSIETSLKELRTEVIDLLQIHNTRIETLQCEECLELLEEVKRKGLVRIIGASSYARGEEVPLASMRDKRIRVLQMPFNLLDQVVSRRVFPEAAEQNRGVLVRSAFLRGVLTDQVNSIPERLAPLSAAALNALRISRGEVESLSEAALRFCLSFAEVSSVIIGVRSLAELEENLVAAGKGPLSAETLVKLRGVVIEDTNLLDTTQWKDLTR